MDELWKTDILSMITPTSDSYVVSHSTAINMDIFRLLIGVVICCCTLVMWKRKRAHSLPGPWALPVVGALPFLGLRVHETFNAMRKKYGDIFQVQIGCQSVVVLCGAATIRTALTTLSPFFDGRPKLYSFSLTSAGKSMVFNSYGPEWKIHRKLSEHALKMASGHTSGFFKNVVVREARRLVDHCLMVSKTSCAMNPHNAVLWSVAHIKYSLCYGDSYVDADFRPMVDNTIKLIECHNRGNVINFFPWGKLLFQSNFCTTTKICDNMLNLTVKKEEEHLSSFRDGRIRDVLDALIHLGIKDDCSLEPDRVMHTVQEYIGAGLDIVYTAVHWMILYLANFPEIQTKIRAEVDDVVGRGKDPEESALNDTPYCHAFLWELLRHTSMVPFCIPHCTSKEVTLGSHHIPKDVFILVNLYSIHHDEQLWTDPELFRPERFLFDNGGLMCPNEGAFFPFGLGRRKCVGEKLSMKELFVYLVMIVQGSEVVKPSHVVSYDLKPKFGVILRPTPFQVAFQPRPE